MKVIVKTLLLFENGCPMWHKISVKVKKIKMIILGIETEQIRDWKGSNWAVIFLFANTGDA